MEKKRIEYIDLAKGICILLVVHLHVVDVQEYFTNNVSYGFLDRICFSFRMPLYFFLSGMFFKTYGGGIAFFIKKVNRLLIPFVFFVLLYWFYGVCLELLGLSREENLIDFRRLIAFFYEEEYKGGALWFLLCLFEVNIIYCFIYLVFKENVKWVAITALFLGLIGYWMYFEKYWDLPAYLDRAFYYLPFFSFGELIRRFSSFLENRNTKIEVLLLFVMVGAYVLLHPEFNILSSKNNIFLFYFLGLLGTLIILQISKLVKYVPIISYVGRYSIVVLCLHDFFLGPLARILWRFMTNVELVVFVEFLVIILVLYFIIPLCVKYFPYIFAQKDLFKVSYYKE